MSLNGTSRRKSANIKLCYNNLATNNSYVLKVSVYSGKKKSNDNDLGKTAAVVINILENYLEKKCQAFDDNC